MVGLTHDIYNSHIFQNSREMTLVTDVWITQVCLYIEQLLLG